MVLNQRTAPRAIAVLLAAAVGGCAFPGDTGVVRSATLNRQIDVSEAFITPPPGGPAVIAVLENRYTNALAQDIILENASGAPGQNVIIVRAYGPMGRDAGRTALPLDTLDLVDIRRELVEQFPGIRMEVSGLYAQNRYGPFSYATGRSHSGANCVYAWQRIAQEARLFSSQRGAISWRMRVCDPNTDTRSLLLLAYGLTINGYFLSRHWNPYGDPPAPDPRIGVPGEVIFPAQVVDPTVIAPVSFGAASETRIAAPQATRRRSTRRRARPRTRAIRTVSRPAQPVVLNDPIEGAAVVPRPEATDLTEPTVEDSNLPLETGPTTRVPTGTTRRNLVRPQAAVPSPSVSTNRPAGAPAVRVIDRSN